MHQIAKNFFAPCFFLTLAVGFILFGIHRGEAMMVYQKAINLCLECVGIG